MQWDMGTGGRGAGMGEWSGGRVSGEGRRREGRGGRGG